MINGLFCSGGLSRCPRLCPPFLQSFTIHAIHARCPVCPVDVASAHGCGASSSTAVAGAAIAAPTSPTFCSARASSPRVSANKRLALANFAWHDDSPCQVTTPYEFHEAFIRLCHCCFCWFLGALQTLVGDRGGSHTTTTFPSPSAGDVFMRAHASTLHALRL